MSKKYIKLITFGNFPYGGASANYLRYLSLSLSFKNDVEVLIPNGYYYGKSKNNKRVGNIDKVKYRYLGFKNHPKNILGKLIDNISSYILTFSSLLFFNMKEQTKVIILYNIFFTETVSVLLTRLFTKNKYIVIIPEFYEKPSSFISKIKWYNFYFGIKYLVRFFHGAIVLTEFLNNVVLSNSNGIINTLILPNFVDPEIFKVDNVKKYKENSITIGYTGTPARKDGATDLIKSFAILNKKYPNTHLLIIGDITNGKSILAGLKELAKSLNVLNSITFTGLVPFSDIPKLLNSCQILTLTRPKGVFAEAGFPTKLGEYFACKKPVVVTSVGDIPKYFENEKHVILVEPENIEEIAQGFEKLVQSKELREKISNNAYRWMDNNLNYKNISKNIDTFLSNILNTAKQHNEKTQ